MGPDEPDAAAPGGARKSPALWSYDDGWKSAAPAPARCAGPFNQATGPIPVAPAEDPRSDDIPSSAGITRRGSAGGVSESRPDGRDSDGTPSGPAAGRRPAPGHPEDAPGDPESVARAICLRLLTLQPRTRAELATALSKRGVPNDAAEAVLSRFTEVGLIDDRAFAAAWVDSRHAGRGLARRALAAELRRRGVDGEVVGEAVAVVDAEAEERTARRLVDRRLPSTRRLDQPARIRRLAGMLARKGYPPGLAMRVVRDALAAEGTDPGDIEESFPED